MQTPCSLSLSLLLRPAIKVCKQFGSRRSSDVPDQGQTSIPRVIISSDFASAEKNISDKYLLSDACHGRIQRGGGGQKVLTPQKNHKNIGFPSNIDADPLKITKLPSQHSMVGCYRHTSKTPFQWHLADGSMVAHF